MVITSSINDSFLRPLFHCKDVAAAGRYAVRVDAVRNIISGVLPSGLAALTICAYIHELLGAGIAGHLSSVVIILHQICCHPDIVVNPRIRIHIVWRCIPPAHNPPSTRHLESNVAPLGSAIKETAVSPVGSCALSELSTIEGTV